MGGVEKLWGGDFLARGGIPGCALRNGPLFSGSLRNSVSAMPFPFLAFVAFGTRKGLLRYGIDTRCQKRHPTVRDAFSEALRAQNRLLGYRREIRYQKHPSTVRGAAHHSEVRCTRKPPSGVWNEAIGCDRCVADPLLPTTFVNCTGKIRQQRLP